MPDRSHHVGESQPSLFEDPPDGGLPLTAVYDEMVTGGRGLRPHWQHFLAAHGPFAREEMEGRWKAARRLLFQNGVTFNAYGDPQGTERPWPLDPIPLLLPAAEWQGVVAGLVQRATLLERVLDDLYGPQDLIRDGTIPPALLLADPGFLRPCHGVPVAGGRRLVLVAVDLVRSPEGRWRVLACRTQAPTGAGYALENRAVLSQTLGEMFRACGVERLAPFFEALRGSLARMAPQRSAPGGNPRAVLLTPGPFNEAHFEHAFLARHLGLTLAEGADLTVRDQAVFLKTLAGLERVDVVLRRVDDDFCDPLELRLDSALGVPGLVQAVRAGTVAVANALGSGLAESMALLSRMPVLARRLLGEALLLEDVPTVWGGDTGGAQPLLDGLDRMIFRPAFPALGSRVYHGPDLSPAARDDLARRIAANPGAWVARQPFPPSTAPVWREGRVEARPVVLRAFLCANEQGWAVMPGGLVRISADARYAVVSLQEGAGAKDLWIIGGDPDHRVRPVAAPDGARELSPVPGDLPSRAADHLFWMGRYAERAAAAVRLLRAATSRLSDESRPGAEGELVPLLRLMGSAGMIPLQIAQLPRADAQRGLRQALEIVADPANPGGIRATVERLRRAGAGVRDRLPLDVGQLLAGLDGLAGGPVESDPAGLGPLLDEMATLLAALAGLELDGMSRGPGWRFLVLGRRLERAIGIVDRLQGSGLLLDRQSAAPVLEVLLELAEAAPAYRERFPVGVRREAVLALLLAEQDHPHALAFQLDAIGRQLSRLPPPGDEGGTGAILANTVAEALALARDPATQRDTALLSQALATLSRTLPGLSDLLSQAYFNHAYAQPT